MYIGSCSEAGSRGADFAAEAISLAKRNASALHWPRSVTISVFRLGAWPLSFANRSPRSPVVNDGLAVRVGQTIGDLAFGRVVADRHAYRACASDRKAGFDPLHRIRQHDRDGVVRRYTAIGKMPREPAGAVEQLGIGDRRLRIAIGRLAAARRGVPPQQFRDGRDQFRRAASSVLIKPC